ncbi:SRPBCC family protein [Pseudodonghicola flavimaris]|uniref:SRPBCC family protein n=1 Tax=Pseudodonghicola flavimaris TaxID=3050036 RepID=A0ABT7EVQ6_9RHOB|nr:SRPBCC family protein [Pseudodonghicola flavimaris]MDK3016370.1 SRPBCC family protein [Pseudodonghicola flavimaris]
MTNSTPAARVTESCPVNPGAPMKFAGKEIINAPIDTVWTVLIDKSNLESWANDHGLPLTRAEGEDAIGVGTSWTGTFSVSLLSGKVVIKAVESDVPNRLAFETKIAGITAATKIVLKQKTENSTVIRAVTTLAASSPKGHLAMAGIRLKKNSAEAHYKTHIKDFFRKIRQAA